jgi:uncharacterized protein YkwD
MLRALVLAAALSCQGQGEAPSGRDDVRALEARMAELVNLEREARGLPALALSLALTELGRAYSARMANAQTVHHELDAPVEDRILAALPGTCTFGENLSKHTTIDYSMGDLMASPGHRANLLSDRFTLIGIGIVHGEDGFLYITQEFARPCDPKRRRKQ